MEVRPYSSHGESLFSMCLQSLSWRPGDLQAARWPTTSQVTYKQQSVQAVRWYTSSQVTYKQPGDLQAVPTACFNSWMIHFLPPTSSLPLPLFTPSSPPTVSSNIPTHVLFCSPPLWDDALCECVCVFVHVCVSAQSIPLKVRAGGLWKADKRGNAMGE